MNRNLGILFLTVAAGCSDAVMPEPESGGAGDEVTAAGPMQTAEDPGAMTHADSEPVAAAATLFLNPLPALRTIQPADEGPFDPTEVMVDDAPKISFTASTRVSPSWNSTAGRALVADQMVVAPDVSLTSTVSAVLPQLRANKEACVAPSYMTGSQTISLPDGRKLRAPATRFATAADASAYLKTVYAAMPFYYPFTHSHVRLGGGWMYNSGGSHRAQDYSRDNDDEGDPTFVVKSVAPGTVLEVKWAEGGGNRVVVEHVAPNGFKYVTQYLHLRNGRTHDLGKALAIDCTGKESRCPKYVKFAQNYSNHVSWGTDAHKILVKVGDKVGYHTALGYAGNTGYGGAGWGLNDDGSPEDHDGNTHLHTYWGAQDPVNPQDFVMIDPYGVYHQEDTGCYDLLEDTEFDRLFAPFYSSFHELPLEVLLTYFGYYGKMGMSPKTLMVYNGDDGVEAVGAFQRGIPGTWKTRINYDGAGFQSWFDSYYGQGLIPRETTVREGSSGPRYTATWRPLRPGEQFDHRGAMSNTTWSQKWQSLVADAGWRVESYFAYTYDGQPRQAALFTSDTPRPFYLHRNKTFTEIQALINGGFANGLAPVDLTAVDLDVGRRYSAILRPESGCWSWWVGMTKTSYQTKFSELGNRGYSLYKVQAYGDDDDIRFLGVWKAPARAVCP